MFISIVRCILISEMLKNVRWRMWENVSKLKKYDVLQIRVENAKSFPKRIHISENYQPHFLSLNM